MSNPSNGNVLDLCLRDHTFFSGLCEVASVLTPSQIGSAIRTILRKQRNTTVLLGVSDAGLRGPYRCITAP